MLKEDNIIILWSFACGLYRCAQPGKPFALLYVTKHMLNKIEHAGAHSVHDLYQS